MKKSTIFVAIATFMTLLCSNVAYSNLSYSSTANDICDKSLSNTTIQFESSASQSTCASSCSEVASGGDCGSAVYEGQEYSGNATNSTLNGNGSGLGCEYFGYGSPLQLGAGTGASFTYCTEYTANSEEASYVAFFSSANSSCWNKSVQVYESNTCSPASVGLVQPVGNSSAKATALRAGDNYTVCYTFTENGCASNFQSSIFEFCSSIIEIPYCSSAPAPAPTMDVCSGEDFEIDLGLSCIADSDLTTGFNNGLSGYAAF